MLKITPLWNFWIGKICKRMKEYGKNFGQLCGIWQMHYDTNYRNGMKDLASSI